MPCFMIATGVGVGTCNIENPSLFSPHFQHPLLLYTSPSHLPPLPSPFPSPSFTVCTPPEQGSAAFEDFLSLLGKKVKMKGFTKYRAQLDNKSKYC